MSNGRPPPIPNPPTAGELVLRARGSPLATLPPFPHLSPPQRKNLISTNSTHSPLSSACQLAPVTNRARTPTPFFPPFGQLNQTKPNQINPPKDPNAAHSAGCVCVCMWVGGRNKVSMNDRGKTSLGGQGKGHVAAVLWVEME